VDLSVDGCVNSSVLCRGLDDEVKRRAALAEKYLQPLTHYGKIVYRAKTARPALGMTLTTDVERVTPPQAGTSVYPGGKWQLPG
jgi:hypothetical protein